MIVTKNKIYDEERNLEWSEKTYSVAQFNGPFMDFDTMETKKSITITMKRSYAEDSKYANIPFSELAISALKEIRKDEPTKDLFLKIWGMELKLSKETEVSKFDKIVFDFIKKNVTF